MPIELLDPPSTDSTPEDEAMEVHWEGVVKTRRTKRQDDRATPSLWRSQATMDSQGYEGVLRQIATLASADECDEIGILRPTKWALRQTLKILGRAVMASWIEGNHVPFPAGCVTSDTEGGIRIEWSDNGHAVHLVVRSNRDQKSYVYFEMGDIYGTVAVSGSNLAQSLRRVFGRA